jgi:hypothetical protein
MANMGRIPITMALRRRVRGFMYIMVLKFIVEHIKNN